MINIIKFKSRKDCEIYNDRERLYSRISSLEELYSEYISLEPHCFLHAGVISNTIKKKNLNGISAISIGIDILKESTLVKNNNLNIDVFDIDKKAVALANKFSYELQISDTLKYFEQNILSEDFRIQKGYEILILSQMDYIFSDKDIELLLKKISMAKIKYILIITPSIYSFSPSPYKTLDLIKSLLSCIKSNLITNPKKYFTTYKRRESYFLSLFRKHFYCDYKFDYVYPSGREYLFLLKSKKSA